MKLSTTTKTIDGHAVSVLVAEFNDGCVWEYPIDEYSRQRLPFMAGEVALGLKREHDIMALFHDK